MSSQTYDQLDAFFGDAAKAQARLYVTLNYDGSNYTKCNNDSNTVLGQPIWQLMNARNYTFTDTDKTKGKNVLATAFFDFITAVATHHRELDEIGAKRDRSTATAKELGKRVYGAWAGLTQDARDFYEQNVNFVHSEKPYWTRTATPEQIAADVRLNLLKSEDKTTTTTVFGGCIPFLPPGTVSEDGGQLVPEYLREIYKKIAFGQTGGYQRGGTGAEIPGIISWVGKGLDVKKFIEGIYTAQTVSAKRELSVKGEFDDVYYDMAQDQVFSRDATGNLQVKGADGKLVSADTLERTTGVPSTIYTCILKGDPKELSRCLGAIDDASIYDEAQKEVKQMNRDTLIRLLATFAVEQRANGASEEYLEWVSSLHQRLSAKMGADKGNKTADAILKNKKLCKYIKTLMDFQRVNTALHNVNNANLSDLPQRTISTKSSLAYFRAPEIKRADALSRSLGLMVQNLNVLPQDMLSLFRPGIQSNLSYGHPLAGIAGMGGMPGMPMGAMGFMPGMGGIPGMGGMGFSGQYGGGLEDVHVQNLRAIYGEILQEMTRKGKDLVQEDKDRIERAINQIEKNNKQVSSALADLKAFVKLDNVITNGLGNTVGLNEISGSSRMPNVRRSISNLENCVNRTSRDQVSLLTALIEQVYRPMLLIANNGSSPFMRPL